MMAMSLVQHVRIWYFFFSLWKRNNRKKNLICLNFPQYVFDLILHFAQ